MFQELNLFNTVNKVLWLLILISFNSFLRLMIRSAHESLLRHGTFVVASTICTVLITIKLISPTRKVSCG